MGEIIHCKQGLNWDDDVSDTEAVQWQAWLQTLTVSQCYKPIDFGRINSYELHHFSDGSVNAYGAGSYLCVMDDHGRIQYSFVTAKSRLAPVKTMSTPRLELTAAVLGEIRHIASKRVTNYSLHFNLLE